MKLSCRQPASMRLLLAVMMGVRRGVNPALRVAGDGVGRADVYCS